jgi:uncharacterized protein YxjI
MASEEGHVMADSPLPAEVDPPPDGWSRVLCKSTFGAGRDFDVSDTSGTRVLFVDGEFGPIPKAEVRDAKDTVVYRAKGHLLAIPRRMAISTADGAQVAELKAKALSIVKDKSTLTMGDGGTWQVQGTLLEQNYLLGSPRVAVVAVAAVSHGDDSHGSINAEFDC